MNDSWIFTLAALLNSSDAVLFVLPTCVAGALALSLLRRTYGFTVLATLGLTLATTEALKETFKVARPEDALVIANGYRFPSMHAALTAAFMISVVWYTYAHTRSKRIRIAMVSAGIIITAFVSYTRILLQVHVPIDLFAGIALGTSVSLIVHMLARKFLNA